MTDLKNSSAFSFGASSEPSDSTAEDAWRVLTNEGPLGSIRLTVRAIARAEGFVFCRHGSLRPVVVTEQEWQALPLAADHNFDV